MVFISIIAKLIKHKEEFHIPNHFLIKNYSNQTISYINYIKIII